MRSFTVERLPSAFSVDSNEDIPHFSGVLWDLLIDTTLRESYVAGFDNATVVVDLEYRSSQTFQTGARFKQEPAHLFKRPLTWWNVFWVSYLNVGILPQAAFFCHQTLRWVWLIAWASCSHVWLRENKVLKGASFEEKEELGTTLDVFQLS